MNTHPSNRLIHLAFVLFCFTSSHAQEIPVQWQQQLENLAGSTEEENEDDSRWQTLERFIRHPLNINEADEDALNNLGLLNEWQVLSLLRYRQMLGRLISVYELQAVPGWEPALIRKLLPFITVNASAAIRTELLKRFRGGMHTFLFRMSGIVEKQKGFDRSTGQTTYAGSPYRIFARYRYTYKNLLQFGWAGDKDAGEQFFRGKQAAGFDFNSLHLFARKIGKIESLALGDFTVSLGQGLTHWQGLAFGKSGETMSVKRQAPVLRPYNSAGEYQFHRGIGLTVRQRNLEWTVFASLRRLSANVKEDSLGKSVSSIITSGYHRTVTEAADKNVLKQFAAGGNIRYRLHAVKLGINLIHHAFSLPIKKEDELYNLFSLKGKKWTNLSADFSFMLRNMHFFGEAAVDQRFHRALITGCLISADPAVDISIVYRKLDREYQAINANAFTAASTVSNEHGLYIGLALRPVYGWRVDAYLDYYQFPWLKYQVDAPGYGSDALLQCIYTPDKQVEWQARFTYSIHTQEAVRTTAIDYLQPVAKTGIQLSLDYAVNKSVRFRSRTQLLWMGSPAEKGYSLSIDGLYKPPARSFSFSARLQFFETDGYGSRLYAFENDVLYSYSVPAVYGNGCRYYLVGQLKPAKGLSLNFRVAQTVYYQQKEIGSGLDLIKGNTRTELKLQIIYSLSRE